MIIAGYGRARSPLVEVSSRSFFPSYPGPAPQAEENSKGFRASDLRSDFHEAPREREKPPSSCPIFDSHVKTLKFYVFIFIEINFTYFKIHHLKLYNSVLLKKKKVYSQSCATSWPSNSRTFFLWFTFQSSFPISETPLGFQSTWQGRRLFATQALSHLRT